MDQQSLPMRLAMTVAMTALVSLLVEGCGGAASFFFLNKNTQAVRRDTITASGIRSFLQNPQDTVHGIVKLAPVEMIDLQSVPLGVNGLEDAPFNTPHTLNMPAGFSISVYAARLGRPRDLALRDDGTLFYSDFDGKVTAISPDGSSHVIAQGLSSPHGLEMHNGALYYTDETHLYRFDFSSPTSVAGKSTMLSDKLPTGASHYTRAIRWVPADKRFYIAVGSTRNKNIEDDNSHANLLRIGESGGGAPDAATRGGLRDVVAMDVNPASGELWVVDNGTELLSPILPPTEINVIKVGKHYGWPFFYSQNFPDPDYTDAEYRNSPRYSPNPIGPIVELEAHAEALGMRFYNETAFGPDWKNAAIIAYHNIPKVIRLRANPDGSNARQADFITGFEDAQGSVWGRPVSLAISSDGRTMYISDDKAGAIYKVVKL
jgi:glucose/arabinose dehydrogenase